MDWELVTALMMPAVAVAAQAVIESLLSAQVAASMANTGPYDPDRELVGQGLASLGAGLAGVLMVTAARMVNLSIAASILRSTRADALGFAVTAVITISVDLIVAVMIGVVLAGVFALRSFATSGGAHREPLPGEPEPGDERIGLMMLDGPLFFASSDRVLEQVLGTRDVSVVILRLSQLTAVDATGAHGLTEIVQQLEARGITVLIKGLRDQHRQLFTRVGVVSALRHQNHLFTELEPAAEHARSHIRREDEAARHRG